MRQQFPIQLAYGVTVHRVQGGCTVQKAIVCFNHKFFESGQAYGPCAFEQIHCSVWVIPCQINTKRHPSQILPKLGEHMPYPKWSVGIEF